MKAFLVPVVCVFTLGSLQQSEAIRFELRLAEYKAGPGLTEATHDGSDMKVYVRATALVTVADIVEAYVRQDGGDYSVGIMLTPTAGQRVLAATADHTGRPLAILVNGQLMSAPPLRAPMSQRILIDGTFTREEVEGIVGELNKARPKF